MSISNIPSSTVAPMEGIEAGNTSGRVDSAAAAASATAVINGGSEEAHPLSCLSAVDQKILKVIEGYAILDLIRASCGDLTCIPSFLREPRITILNTINPARRYREDIIDLSDTDVTIEILHELIQALNPVRSGATSGDAQHGASSTSSGAASQTDAYSIHLNGCPRLGLQNPNTTLTLLSQA